MERPCAAAVERAGVSVKGAYSAMTTLSQSLRIAAAAALLSLAASSSKNPDSLVGMNLDENAAMMDSNEAVDANAVTATVAETNAGSQPDTISHPDASANEAAPKQPARTKVAASESSDQVNATDADAHDRTELNQIDDNQVEQEPDEPNAVR